jgi:DNA-binding transcriptional ArsR family regulator
VIPLSRGSDIKIIKDPEVAKLLADDTRRRILHMLRHKEMSPADLTKALDKNFSSIQHHLNLLISAGLVEQTKEEKVRNMIQPYYHATAHRYLISYSLTENLSKDDDYTQWQEATLQKMIPGLKVFNITVPEEKRARVLALIDKCVEMERKAFEEVVERQSDPETLEKQVQRPLLQLLTHLTLSKYPDHAAALRELNQLFNL